MADTLDIRMARLEGGYEQISERLGTIEGRLDRLETKVDSGFGEVRREMRTQFYWLLGVIIVAFLVPLVLGVVF